MFFEINNQTKPNRTSKLWICLKLAIILLYIISYIAIVYIWQFGAAYNREQLLLRSGFYIEIYGTLEMSMKQDWKLFSLNVAGKVASMQKIHCFIIRMTRLQGCKDTRISRLQGCKVPSSDFEFSNLQIFWVLKYYSYNIAKVKTQSRKE